MERTVRVRRVEGRQRIDAAASVPAAIVNCTLPPLNVPEPRLIPPLESLTVPVGVPLSLLTETVTVMLSAVVMLDGLAETVTVGVIEVPTPPPVLTELVIPPQAVKQRHAERFNQNAACCPAFRMIARAFSFIAFIGIGSLFLSLRRVDCPCVGCSRRQLSYHEAAFSSPNDPCTSRVASRASLKCLRSPLHALPEGGPPVKIGSLAICFGVGNSHLSHRPHTSHSGFFT